MSDSTIESISAVTLATHDMARAVRFYRMLGFEVVHGGEADAFMSFRAGRSYLNLVAQPAERRWSWWGRVIFAHHYKGATRRPPPIPVCVGIWSNQVSPCAESIIHCGMYEIDVRARCFRHTKGCRQTAQSSG